MLPLVLVGVAVVLSRAPFLVPGYGLDPDAALLVRAGRDLALEGVYNTSRFPGYPVVELAYALAWRGGPIAVNGLTALMSALFAVSFAGVVRRLGGRLAPLAGLAIASVPLIYIQSVGAMDYVWALALLTASMWATVERRPIVAGVLLGLSGACRLATLAFGLPLAIMLATPGDSRRTARYLVRFVATAALSWAVAFSPILIRYGLDFLHYMPFWRSLWESLWMLTIGTWGPLGTIALAVMAVGSLAAMLSGARARPAAIPEAARPAITVACLWGVAIGVGVFLRLPIEAAYALPAIPFLLLVVGSRLEPKLFALSCVLVLAAPFVGLGTGALRAPLLADLEERREIDAYLDAVVHASAGLPEGAVVLVGYIEQELDVGKPLDGDTPVTFSRYLSGPRLEELHASGAPLYYLPEVVANTPGADRAELEAVADPLRVGGYGPVSLPPPRSAGRLRLF